MSLLGYLTHGARHLPVLVPAGLAVAAGSPALAVAWCAATRLAYVVFVGLTLRAEERRGPRAPSDAEAAWRRFRGIATWIMDADAAAFAALCIVTRDTLPVPGPRWVPVLVGAALFVLGLAVKHWAARSLTEGAYFWRSFFVRTERNGLSAKGPYRWLSDPMYTVGYAHAYGLALALTSVPGLLAAAVAQALILAMNHLVERRHVKEQARTARADEGARSGVVARSGPKGP